MRELIHLSRTLEPIVCVGGERDWMVGWLRVFACLHVQSQRTLPDALDDDDAGGDINNSPA